ncbi:MAG: hypothetical protein FWH42_01410 [Dehalococcoidia bacterium]|nr:hypothetical protein [Dehalococcoidia bacterium]
MLNWIKAILYFLWLPIFIPIVIIWYLILAIAKKLIYPLKLLTKLVRVKKILMDKKIPSGWGNCLELAFKIDEHIGESECILNRYTRKYNGLKDLEGESLQTITQKIDEYKARLELLHDIKGE